MSFTLSANANLLLGIDDPTAAVHAGADLGLDAIEFWGIENATSTELTAACADTGVDVSATTGVGLAENPHGSGPGLTDPSRRNEAVTDLKRSLAIASDLGIETLVVTVGPARETSPPGTEHRAIVRALREVAPTADTTAVDIVIEPLNTRVDHPGYYLNSSHEAYEIVDAVDSPSISVLFDVYHQQITEGNVIQNLTAHVEYVGYIHVAAVPGRHQPGTGELAYGRIFEALADVGYDGYIGLEYAPTIDPADTIETVRSLVP